MATQAGRASTDPQGHVFYGTIRRSRWVQRVAVAGTAVVLIWLTVAWARVAAGANHGLMVAPDASGTSLEVVINNAGAAVNGVALQTGDRLLAVDGIPASQPAASAAFWQARPAGTTLPVRVQRAGSTVVEEGTVPIINLLTDRGSLLLFSVTTLYGLIWLGMMLLVTMTRPDEPATWPLLWVALIASLIAPLGITINVPTADWPIVVRLLYFLTSLNSIALLHLFLVFPSPVRLASWLRGWGPLWLRRYGGGLLLLDCALAALSALLDLGPIATAAMAALPGLCCLLATFGLLARRFLRPRTALERAQMLWIVLAVSAAALVWGATAGLVVASQHELQTDARTMTYVAQIFIPVALAFAVLRYRLFDVSSVARAGVTYTALTVLLLVGYLVVTFAISQTLLAIIGPERGRSSTAAVLAALVMALVAAPARSRLQNALDRLVYRARVARRRYLDEAVDALSHTQPLETLLSFLSGHTPHRLNLASAWVALPPGSSLMVAEYAPPPDAPIEPLFERLRAVQTPAFLSRDDLSASAITSLPADDPALAPWYEAGARILVPLRASTGDVTPATAASAGRAAPPDAATDLIGVWALGEPRSGTLPERGDLDAVTRVGRLAAVLLDHVRLTKEQVRQALVDQELSRARDIQQRLLPPPHQGWPGILEIAARLRPARETSGDFYDVFSLAPAATTRPSRGASRGERAADGAESEDAHYPLQIAVGDVQGKGMGAALVMGLAQAILRTAAERLHVRPAPIPVTAPADGAASARGVMTVASEGTGAPMAGPDLNSPAMALSLAGRLLHRTVGMRDFVACALAVVEPPQPGRPLRLRLANGAQVPPQLYRNGQVLELRPAGEALPLGILAAPAYQETVLELLPNDVVVFASDGMTEAPATMPPGGEIAGAHTIAPPTEPGEYFGFERLSASIAFWGGAAQSAQAVLDGIWSDLDAWSGPDSRHDDMTLLVLRVPGEYTGA